MGTLHLTPQAQLDATQRILRADVAARRGDIGNVDAAILGHDIGWVEYRGRSYDVPPVPYREGLVLMALGDELRRLAPDPDVMPSGDVLEQVLVLLSNLLDTMGRCVRPPWWRRLAARLRLPLAPWRPFDDAEGNEVAALLAFFANRRTRSGVRGSMSRTALPRYQRTWPITSPPSPGPIPVGWWAARRAVFAITKSATRRSTTTRSAA
ncbi:MAG TPA: hypothetical protein VLD58_12350 [Gemmatimonadales bacterium]|nr:hypothetical protein [Gemmatimonadales bacterium]